MTPGMRLLCVGDVMLGRMVNEAMNVARPIAAAEWIWGDTLPLFGAADACLCNLECVLCHDGKPWGALPGQTWKMFHFRADPEHVEAIEHAGIDAVSVANNHALDYQIDGLREMLAVLDGHGIRHAGAGQTEEQARLPALWQKKGLRLGMLAITDNEPDWAAGPEQGGVWQVTMEGSGEEVSEGLRQMRASADLRMVSAHWGGNAGYRPPPEHRQIARQWIEAGAGLVFGHSSHVFRGVEIYRGAAILYGAGDFVDDYAVDLVERNDEAMAFALDYSDDGHLQGTSMFPCRIGECRVQRAHGKQAQRIGWRMMELCEELGTATEWDEAAECVAVRMAGAEERAPKERVEGR